MKRLIIILLLGSLIPAGCQDITIGYLLSEHAEYPIDSMEIRTHSGLLKKMADLNEELQELKLNMSDLLERRTEIKNLIKDLDARTSSIETEYGELGEQIEALEQAGGDQAQIDALYAQQDLLLEEYDEVGNKRSAAYKDLNVVNAQIDEIGSPDTIENEMANIQARLDENIPWATSMIDGVKGTQPFSYRLAGIKNDNGNAGVFETFVTVSGGGRVHVSSELEVPAGKYVISIYVENEGRTNLIEDVFTFIVK